MGNLEHVNWCNESAHEAEMKLIIPNSTVEDGHQAWRQSYHSCREADLSLSGLLRGRFVTARIAER